MPNYKSIHTNYGLQRLAEAEATNAKINLIEMAVGDGNGNPVNPSPVQATLVRERYRAGINRVYPDPETPNHYFAELVIPASVGNFTLREVAVFDSSGGMFVVGNLPEMYKPTPDDGAFGDSIIRIQFSAQNASIITLQIDPNVAVASQFWVTNNVKMATLVPRGTTGQILTKVSNADGDADWSDPNNINITVDTIEETQTLATAQTIVDLVATTTRGLALYIDGNRLRRDQWTADLDIVTRLSLAVSHPSGTRLICVQNEPTGSAPAPLERSKNLSDINNAATARTNLGVYSKAETDQMAPVGQIAYTAKPTAPAGWLKANGAAISRTAYARLFAAIGTTYGNGDGFNTFKIPDLRGEFIRGFDDGSGIDNGRVFGSLQIDSFASHAHNSPTNNGVVQSIGREVAGNTRYGYDYFDSTGAIPTSSTGGTETRPRNVALLAIIKF